MRVGNDWTPSPLAAKLGLFWERVTFSRITIFYFTFSVLHCLVQVIFQAQAFTINAKAVSLLRNIIAQGNTTGPGFAVFDGPDLHWCKSVPSSPKPTSCPIVWSENGKNSTSPEQDVIAYGLSNNSSQALSMSASLSRGPLPSATATVAPPVSPTVPAPTLPSATGPSNVPSSTLGPLSSSTAVFVVTLAPTAFSRAPDVPKLSESVTRTLTVVLQTTPTPPIASTSNRTQSKRAIEVVGAHPTSGGALVRISDLDGSSQVELDRKCLLALSWPESQVKNTKREDVVFICFQIWVLGMSIVALLNESIPHMFASLLTHVMATAWGGFQIYSTKQFRADFVRLTTEGACGVNLLPTYWKDRENAEIPSLALNCVALLVSIFLTWRLIKLFGWQTFKRVGASLTIKHVYNVVLVLSIVIQLSSFFILISGGLWIDQTVNGDIGLLAAKATAFQATMVVVLVLLLPWLAIGWISVRRELKVPMLIFLSAALLYLIGWSMMFVSSAFRWTFMQWRFFGLMTTASVTLTAVTFILGIVCRVNFGKGLRNHLESHDPLEDEDRKSDYGAHTEKVEFPISRNTIPVFSTVLGLVPKAVVRTHATSQPAFTPIHEQTLGGFYGASYPTSAGLPSGSLVRQESNSSRYSAASASSSHVSRSKRWIIE